MAYEAHSSTEPFIGIEQPALDGDAEVASLSIYYTPPDSPVGATSMSLPDEPSTNIEAEGFIVCPLPPNV